VTDLEEAKRQLNEILSRSEFAHLRSKPEGEEMPSLPVFQLPQEWVWGIYLFVAVVIIILLIYYGVKWWRDRQRNEDSSEDLVYSSFEKAQSYALKGEYRLAVRSLFQY
jgi:flagellar biosynthesis/type III secretory pathway M-ring protein FliF/YscJ